MQPMEKIIIYTDGASKGNPGPGGWGAVIAHGDRVTELGGREENTTNNRMELLAALEALRFVSRLKPAPVVFRADSAYVINGATKWGVAWKKRGWKTLENEDVRNRDLWEPLLELVHALSPQIQWETVGGHIDVPGNERADAIASGFAFRKKVLLYDGSRGGYPIDLADIVPDLALQKKKSELRSRAKLPAYSYVSKVDGIVLVHKTWPECEARVRGKKARFKKALSADEEKQIVKQFSGKSGKSENF